MSCWVLSVPLGSPIEREREREERPKESEDVHWMSDYEPSQGKEEGKLVACSGNGGYVGAAGSGRGIRDKGEERHWPEGFRFPTRSLGFTCRKWEAGRVYFEQGRKWWTWCLKTQEALAQGLANYCHQAKTGLPSVFVTEVFVGTQWHSFVCVLCTAAFSPQGRVGQLQYGPLDHAAAKPDVFHSLSGPHGKSLMSPAVNQGFSTSKLSAFPCCRGCPVGCKMFQNVLDPNLNLHPLHKSSTPTP